MKNPIIELNFPDCMTEVTGNRKRELINALLVETCDNFEPWQPQIYQITESSFQSGILPISTYVCNPDLVIKICNIDREGMYTNSIFTIGLDIRDGIRESYITAKLPAMMNEENNHVLVAYHKPQSSMWHLKNIATQIAESAIIHPHDYTLYRMDKEVAVALFSNFKLRPICCDYD